VALTDRSSVAATAGILERLRSETRVVHVRAETRVQVVADSMDTCLYAQLLRALLPVYAYVEMRVESFDEWPTLRPALEVASRRRTHLLLEDLVALGDAGEPLVPRVALPCLGHFAETFGALYVVEGSRLGGPALAALRGSNSRVRLWSTGWCGSAGCRDDPSIRLSRVLRGPTPVRPSPRCARARHRAAGSAA